MPFKKERHRYIKFHISIDNGVDEDGLYEKIQKITLQLYGIKGLSQIEPKLIEFNVNELTGILRCNHSFLGEMRAALMFITNISGLSAAVRVVKVSGTIKGLQK